MLRRDNFFEKALNPNSEIETTDYADIADHDIKVKYRPSYLVKCCTVACSCNHQHSAHFGEFCGSIFRIRVKITNSLPPAYMRVIRGSSMQVFILKTKNGRPSRGVRLLQSMDRIRAVRPGPRRFPGPLRLRTACVRHYPCKPGCSGHPPKPLRYPSRRCFRRRCE